MKRPSSTTVDESNTTPLARSWLTPQTKMSAFATGAFAGVLVQLYSNGVRKLPLMRRKFQTLFNEYFSTIPSRRRNPLFFFLFYNNFP